ncbi:hypothetical protein [Bacillus glycinifermentans]|uniref:hypothetical protein n=1 Tax=Bacillus glycinifermentans TaxID=1664069 RepID=UPI001FF486FE|nr:hypothetical protein [Bacillus glycinifermentans]UOY86865.1 hypothetical protein MW696_12140 [Bacillus glycinifermentans]
MTKDQLEEIRQRAEAATEGPWHYVITAEGAYILDQDSDLISGECAREQDARFIASARQDIPALLDHIAEIDRKLRKAELIIGRVEDLLSSIQHGTGYEVYDEVYRFIYEEGDENADDR